MYVLWECIITADETEAPKVYKATIVYKVPVKYCNCQNLWQERDDKQND
jgi:hypothetical protein